MVWHCKINSYRAWLNTEQHFMFLPKHKAQLECFAIACSIEVHSRAEWSAFACSIEMLLHSRAQWNWNAFAFLSIDLIASNIDASIHVIFTQLRCVCTIAPGLSGFGDACRLAWPQLSGQAALKLNSIPLASKGWERLYLYDWIPIVPHQSPEGSKSLEYSSIKDYLNRSALVPRGSEVQFNQDQVWFPPMGGFTTSISQSFVDLSLEPSRTDPLGSVYRFTVEPSLPSPRVHCDPENRDVEVCWSHWH